VSVDRALWFVAPRQVELRPTSLPELAPGSVRVRTSCSGISAGTELLAYRGELPQDVQIDETIDPLGDATFTYPFRYGYSSVGIVEARGPDVAHLSVGDQVFAFHPHQERFDIDASAAIPVPNLAARHAVFLPYVETALQVTLDAGPIFGETIVVSGLGVLGFLVARLALHAGASVVAAEPQPWRRDAATSLGIDAVPPDAVRDIIGADGVALGIECSGNPAALGDMLGLLAHEGTALVASWYGTKPVELPLGLSFHRRRLTIRSTQVSTIPAHLRVRWDHQRRMSRAVTLAGALPLGELATDTVAFDEAADAYGRLDRGDPGVFHVALGYG
jgi:2-desacetyl-2-hydroxyethyl bacteriochlorophyllide A dehydrogenase